MRVPTPEGETFSDRYARWLDAVLDHFGVPRAAFLTSSFGGWVALDYATRRPERVAALALRCPIGLGPVKKGFVVKAVLLSLLGEKGRRKSVAGTIGEPETSPIVGHQLLVSAHYRYRTGPFPVFGGDETAARSGRRRRGLRTGHRALHPRLAGPGVPDGRGGERRFHRLMAG